MTQDKEVPVLLEQLDVSRLPQMALHGPMENSTEVARIAYGLRNTFDSWARCDQIMSSSHLGLAVGRPNPVFGQFDPYSSVWFVAGWSAHEVPYTPAIIDAVHLLGEVMQTGKDTLAARHEQPNSFEPQGAVPVGGGTLVPIGDVVIPCAISGPEVPDAIVIALTVGGHIGRTVYEINHLPVAST